MSDTQGEVRVRTVTPQRNESIFESVVEFAGGLLRFGFSVASLPLALLPAESRQHLRNATKELAYAVVSLPRDFAAAASEKIEEWANEPGAAPKDEMGKA